MLATRSERVSDQCCPLGRVPRIVQVSSAEPGPWLSVALTMSYSRWFAATMGTHDEVVTDVWPVRSDARVRGADASR